MKGLYGYICEGYEIGAGFTEDDCINYFLSHIKKINNFERELRMFVNFMYGLWEEKFNNGKIMIPFRFSNNSVKIHDAYEVFANDIKLYCEKIGLDCKLQSDGFKLNNQKIYWGKGSIFGNRSEKGLGYEDTVVEEIIIFLNTVYPLLEGNIKNKNKIKFEDLNLDIKYKRMFDIFTFNDSNQSFDGILQDMINNPNLDLSEHVFKTGTKEIFRNSKNQIFNNIDFEINKNVNNTLKDSGNIIADITIMSSKGPLYISVKMKVAQTSGINFSNCFGNKAFQQGIKLHKSFDEIKNDSQLIGFLNFCALFGLNPEDVYNSYLNKKFGKLEIGKCDSKSIGELVQMIIGGNYWYVNPSYVKFIDDKNRNFKVDISAARITDSGAAINFTCKINGIPGEIRFRTSGKRRGRNWIIQAPYRLFVYTDIMKLYNR